MSKDGQMSIKITTQSINKALVKIDRLVEGISKDALSELSENIVDYAYDNLDTVIYDGDTSEIDIFVEEEGPRTRRVVATGEAVPYIEYGAGARAKVPVLGGTGPTVNPDGSWYFIDNGGGGMRLTAGGKQYTTTKKKVKRWKTKPGYKNGRRAKWLDTQIEVTERIEVEREHPVIRTYGNPPNAFMYNAYKKAITEDLPNLARKYHNWSTYD